MTFDHEMPTTIAPIIITLRNIISIITKSISLEAQERTPGDLSFVCVPRVQASTIITVMHISFATTLLVAVITFRDIQVVFTPV